MCGLWFNSGFGGVKKGRGCAPYTAIPCRIDRRVPSQARNSGGGLSFPLISDCNARCLTLIFHCPAPHSHPLLSLSISALLVPSPSHQSSNIIASPARSYHAAVSYPFYSPVPLSLPSLCSPLLALCSSSSSSSSASTAFLFLPFGARPSGDQFGATERNVSRPGEIQRHTRTLFLSLFARRAFNRPQGARSAEIAVDFDFYITKPCNRIQRPDTGGTTSRLSSAFISNLMPRETNYHYFVLASISRSTSRSSYTIPS